MIFFPRQIVATKIHDHIEFCGGHTGDLYPAVHGNLLSKAYESVMVLAEEAIYRYD